MINYTHKTRSGLLARILCDDYAGPCADKPVVTAIKGKHWEDIVYLTKDLKGDANGSEHEYDLFERDPFEDYKPGDVVLLRFNGDWRIHIFAGVDAMRRHHAMVADRVLSPDHCVSVPVEQIRPYNPAEAVRILMGDEK